MAPDQIQRIAPGMAPPRILVVDDLPSNRFALSRVLVQTGFAVREAEDGEEAVQIAQSWLPHVVFMDLQMPVLDGFAATRQIRQAVWGARMAVIVLSGDLAETSKANALAAGAIAFLAKPFVQEDVLAMLARELGLTYA